MGIEFLLIAGCFTAAVIGVLFLTRALGQKKTVHEEQQPCDAEKEIAPLCFMGEYKNGLQAGDGAAPIVYCGVTQNFFVMRKGTQGAEIGRIPRTRVVDVTVTQQDGKNSLVTITWQNETGEQCSTTFQFRDKAAAKQAAAAEEYLKRWAVTSTSTQSSCSICACS
ncbi:MAG: hypothetical protein N3B18_05670 [Desulfobacterota bacterium]|nr:hypothetical protein [Thermodesulfobacteriota bacterium]